MCCTFLLPFDTIFALFRLFGRLIVVGLLFYVEANQFLTIGTTFILVNNALAGIEVAGDVKILRLAVAEVCVCIDLLEEIGANGKC